jgi:large conductance mechanosensitive channel
VFQDFKAFLIKQNALALAIGVVIGAALNNVVGGLVEGFIMPIVAAITNLLTGGNPASWQEYTTPGPIPFAVGRIAQSLVNFVIVGLVAWRLSKLFLENQKPAAASPAPAVRQCQFCRMPVDTLATRCAHCTSQL